MICPVDKWTSLVEHLRAINGCSVLSLRSVHRTVGIMIWLCSGFTIGRSSVAALVRVRSAGVFDQRRRERRLGRSVPPSAVDCVIDARAGEAIRFWSVFFSSWDRRCP